MKKSKNKNHFNSELAHILGLFYGLKIKLCFEIVLRKHVYYLLHSIFVFKLCFKRHLKCPKKSYISGGSKSWVVMWAKECVFPI